MPKSYRHLTHEDRCQIHALKKSGLSHRAIARLISRDPRTISREIRRNTGGCGYRYKQAHQRATSRRHHACAIPYKASANVTQWINDPLGEQWSPEQISGRMLYEKGVSLSHEWIYQHVWADKRNGGELYRNLRHSGKKYNKRSGSNGGRGCIPGRVDIDERPEIVEQKQRLGDWELDTIIGAKHQGAIVSAVDRKSKYCVLAKVPDKKAVNVTAKLIECLGAHKSEVLTLTADNGKEFAEHSEIALALEADFYFAKPYQSWQRGLNEHTNGLVRQYLPKSACLKTVTEQEVDQIEILLNNRPRKVLNYQTPKEVFFANCSGPPGGALHT